MQRSLSLDNLIFEYRLLKYKDNFYCSDFICDQTSNERIVFENIQENSMQINNFIANNHFYQCHEDFRNSSLDKVQKQNCLKCKLDSSEMKLKSENNTISNEFFNQQGFSNKDFSIQNFNYNSPSKYRFHCVNHNENYLKKSDLR